MCPGRPHSCLKANLKEGWAGAAQNTIFGLPVTHGQPVYCQVTGKHRGAGGRPSSQQQQGSAITKKGPDSWVVTAQVRGSIRKRLHPSSCTHKFLILLSSCHCDASLPACSDLHMTLANSVWH